VPEKQGGVIQLPGNLFNPFGDIHAVEV
jgi:hypothetical protein